MLKFDHFNATQILREITILANSNGPKMSFLVIQRFSSLILVKLSNFQVPNLQKIQSTESLKLPRMTFLDSFDLPKLVFKFNFTFWKFLEHSDWWGKSFPCCSKSLHYKNRNWFRVHSSFVQNEYAEGAIPITPSTKGAIFSEK